MESVESSVVVFRSRKEDKGDGNKPESRVGCSVKKCGNAFDRTVFGRPYCLSHANEIEARALSVPSVIRYASLH